MSMQKESNSDGGKPTITIYVEGGCVQAVYTTLPESCRIEVELLDFDNSKTETDNLNALEKANELLAAAQKEQRQIF